MTTTAPTMSPQADLYLISSGAKRVKLHVTGLDDTLLIGRAGSAGKPLTGASNGGAADVTVLIGPGVTELHLSAVSGQIVSLAGVEVRQ
jgi:hypothetical protein